MTDHTRESTRELYTDVGNARRFVDQHGSDLRFCKAWGKWLIWDGVRWCVDDTGVVERKAKATIRAMYQEASRVEDSGDRQDYVQHALKSEYAGRIQSMISMAETEDGIPVRPGDLDKDGLLFNCLNGTVDLRTGKMREHRREDLISRLAPVNFDPDAKCPVFDRFLEKIMEDDPTLIQYSQRCIGYALSGDVSEQCMFVLFGSGANGKTTFLEAIRHTLGDYAGQVPVRTLMTKRGDGISNDIAQLKGRRFITSSEVEAGQRLAEAQVKELTGGGMLQGRFLYHEPFHFEPTFKIFMDCNHKPEIGGVDEAIWRRVKLIPFSVTIPKAERDRKLQEKLRAEAPGILAWAVRGHQEWRGGGLREPRKVEEATGAYRKEMDIVAEFIDEECVLEGSASQTSGDLYDAYKEWCKSKVEEPVSKKAFGMRLKDVPGVVDQKVGGKRSWRGIGFKETAKKAA